MLHKHCNLVYLNSCLFKLCCYLLDAGIAENPAWGAKEAAADVLNPVQSREVHMTIATLLTANHRQTTRQAVTCILPNERYDLFCSFVERLHHMLAYAVQHLRMRN